MTELMCLGDGVLDTPYFVALMMAVLACLLIVHWHAVAQSKRLEAMGVRIRGIADVIEELHKVELTMTQKYILKLCNASSLHLSEIRFSPTSWRVSNGATWSPETLECPSRAKREFEDLATLGLVKIFEGDSFGTLFRLTNLGRVVRDKQQYWTYEPARTGPS
ncbi:MAG: hypothetical protein ACPGXK_00140 [Phycisphaerae bacterium]